MSPSVVISIALKPRHNCHGSTGAYGRPRHDRPWRGLLLGFMGLSALRVTC